MTQIGFVGLGAMGLGMAVNLQKHLAKNSQPALVYHNRTIEKGKPVEEEGGKPLGSASEVVEKSDIVFVMLANDASTREMIMESVVGLDTVSVKGKIIVNCSTILPDTAQQLFDEVDAVGAFFVSSPVFGSAPVATAGQLVFTPGGDKAQIAKVEPYMLAMGKSVMYVGPDVRKTLMFKLAGNSFIVGLMELAGESQVFAEKLGIEPELMTEWARELAGPFVGLYFHKNSDGVYDPGANGSPYFTVDNGIKDASYGLKLAKEAGTELPTLANARANMEEAKRLKGAKSNLDASSVYGVLRTRAGLDFENAAVKKREASS